MTESRATAIGCHTPANLAVGWQRLIGPALALPIVLFFYVLFEPLLITRIVFIRRNEIILSQVAYDLYQTDTFLFVIVFGFGIVAPMFKMLGSVVIWYFVDVKQARNYGRWLVILSKLSMLDVLLFALVIVMVKGSGIGSVEIQSGLYVYMTLIVGSFLISLATDHVMEKFLAPGPLSDEAHRSDSVT
jgi:paraquat-inducible protein A